MDSIELLEQMIFCLSKKTDQHKCGENGYCTLHIPEITDLVECPLLRNIGRKQILVNKDKGIYRWRCYYGDTNSSEITRIYKRLKIKKKSLNQI